MDFECGNCLWKRPTFLLLNPGSALKKFAAIVTPENKPTKVNWISHGPVPWKFVEKLFLNKGLISFFLLLAPGSALKNFAAIVNPGHKPTKVNWTLSWTSALEICGKIFLE